jgi:hypothetical protein
MGDFEKLIEAAKHGNVAEVRAIVQSHAELIDQRCEVGATPQIGEKSRFH